MKFKFKVGDRVRAKLEKEYMGVCNGDLGTITENSPCPFVSWDKLNGGTIALDEEELETKIEKEIEIPVDWYSSTKEEILRDASKESGYQEGKTG